MAARAVQGRKILGRLRLLARLILVGAAAFSLCGPAQAYQTGVGFLDCPGCHGALNEGVDVSVDFDPVPSPGEQITVTIRIAYDGMQGAGFFATSGGVGTLEPADSQVMVSADGITHSGPVSASNGQAEVKLLWTLPDTPSGGALSIGAVAANLNRARTGDATAFTVMPVAWGCELVVLYADLDRDGFATEDFGISGGCEESPGWAVTLGDCDQNDPTIFPGAEEICDEKDNDCDGEVDEGTVPIPLYVDADGDGVGVLPEVKVGCVESGYSSESGDCDDNDSDSYPGGTEICDLRDNDCNGRVDDGALSSCGLGSCRREATSCSAETCVPGEPRAETCNSVDDDCDGVVDNDTTDCAPGLVCYLAFCFSAEDAAAIAALSNGGAASTPTPGGTPTAAPADTTGPMTVPNVGGTPNGVGGSFTSPATEPAANGSVGGAGGVISPSTGNGPTMAPPPGLTANGGGANPTHVRTTTSACGVQPRRDATSAWWLALAGAFGLLSRRVSFRHRGPRRE